MCHDFIVSALQKRKNHFPNFGWNLFQLWLEIAAPYRLIIDGWLIMGGSTIYGYKVIV